MKIFYYIAGLFSTLLMAGGVYAYVAQYGDTATSIGKQFGMTASEFCTLNNVEDCNLIYAGQNYVTEGKLGATIPTVIALYEDALATKLNNTSTSTFTLVRGTDKQSRSLSGTYGFVIDEGTSVEEFFVATCSGTTCTIVTRGIDVVDGETNVSANQYEHRRGAVVKISNFPQLAILSRILNGNETTPGGLTFGTNSISGLGQADGSDLTEAVSYQLLASTTWNGAVDSSTTTKGIVEEATDSEFLADTDTGTTGARLFVPPSILNDHSSEHFNDTVTYGETLSYGDVLYTSSTGQYYKASATSQTQVNAISAIAYTAGNAGATNKVLMPGSVLYKAGLTPGAPVYLSDVAGAVSTTKGTYAKVIGQAITTDRYVFNPNVLQETTVPTAGAIPVASSTGKIDGEWLNISDNNASILTSGSTSDASSTHYHSGSMATGQTSRAINSTGEQVITHNLGVVPSYIQISASALTEDSGATGIGQSFGTATSISNQTATYISFEISTNAEKAGQSDNIVVLLDTAGNPEAVASLSGMSSTTFTINWTTNVNSGGTRYLQWTAFK
jgi:hypothetical protein